MTRSALAMAILVTGLALCPLVWLAVPGLLFQAGHYACREGAKLLHGRHVNAVRGGA